MPQFVPIPDPPRPAEGRQVTADNLTEIAEWTRGKVVDDHVAEIPGYGGGQLALMTAHAGQWVIVCDDPFASTIPYFYVRDNAWVQEHLVSVTPA